MRSANRSRRRQSRSQKGALGTVSLLIVLQLCFIAAAVSIDIAHQVSAKAELQAAVDAAAMAGEEILLAPAATQTFAVSAANSICGKNFCDGKLISSNSGATVAPVVGTTGGTPSLPTMTVTASLPVVNLFGYLIGRGSDKINVTATAGPGQVKTAFAIFPMTVINRDYQPNTSYTWYISDAPGLVPGLVNLLSSGLTGYSSGSTPPTYPGTMLGYNTARFLTTFNGSSAGGLLGAVDGLLNGVGGPLGLGTPGTVLGGVVSPTVGTTGSLLSQLLTGNSTGPGPDASALSMLSYYSSNNSTAGGGGSFQLSSNTQPSANYGTFPTLPSTPIATPALSVGQQVLLTSGADSANNNALDTTAQFLQGPSGNKAAGSLVNTYVNSINVTGPGLPTSTTPTLQGSVASWLQNQTIIVAVTNPAPINNSLTVPILNINALGTQDGTTSTYSNSATGLLGPLVQPLTGVGSATPTTAVVDRFVAVTVTSVTVEYQGSNGLGLLGLSLLNNPWAQQVVRITGTVKPYAGASGYGGSSYSGAGSGNASSAYAAMLIR